MTDSVEVRPNITDPDLLPAKPVLSPAQAPAPASGAAGGLLAKIYEHKVAVIIIVLLIIIIAIVAYFMFKRDDEGGRPEQPRPQPVQYQPAPGQAAPDAQPSPAEEQPKPQDNVNLVDLYHRSKAAAAKPVVKPVQPVSADNIAEDVSPQAKSEEEIRGLMEDAAQTEQNNDAETSSVYCSELTKQGHPCKNKATSNGKCRQHGGQN